MVYGVWGVFGRDGGFLHVCSCPESQVTWEPGWDNKGEGWVVVGRVEKHRVSRLPISTNTLFLIFSLNDYMFSLKINAFLNDLFRVGRGQNVERM